MHEHLDVPYHQQDTRLLLRCRLRADGTPRDRPAAAVPERSVTTTIHTHTVEARAWSSPPDGLCWTMNNRQTPKHFTLDSTDTEEPISRTICWAIHHYQCAPIALVFGGNHWVVVRGYTASAAPANLVRHVLHDLGLRPEQSVAAGSRATGSTTAH